MVNCRGAGDPVPDLWQPPKAAAITAFYAIPRENLTCERVAEVFKDFRWANGTKTTRRHSPMHACAPAD